VKILLNMNLAVISLFCLIQVNIYSELYTNKKNSFINKNSG
ncbi:hypothetical protein TNCT_150131, partial [Trichonephila clavata]